MGTDSHPARSDPELLLEEATRLLASGADEAAEERLIRIGTGPGEERARLHALFLLLPMWQRQCRYDRVGAAVEELPGLATRAGDPQDLIQTRLLQAAMSAWQGRFSASMAATADLADPGDGRPVCVDAVAEAARPEWHLDELLMGAALGLWAGGAAGAAWRLADDTLTAWTAGPRALATAAVIAQLDGDRDRVTRLTDAVLDGADGPDDSPARWAAALREWATGSGPPALRGVDGKDGTLTPYLLNLCADRDDVDPESALRWLDDALTGARDSGERFAETETLRIRARVWHRSGRYDRAGADLDVAAAVAREQGARSLELKALNDRLVLTGDHGRLGRLAALLEELGGDGPRRHTETARRILERG